MHAPTPCNEPERLEALGRYAILDTPPESAYDDITWLAASICQVPVAIVNFVDRDRQWFKSEIGLGIRETPLDLSICAYAILQPDLFIVPDTTQDERFVGNPLVTGEPGLRFYAGAPLESSDGHALGTLCVLDYKPRELTEEQKQSLRALARQVMTQMELRVAIAQGQQLNERLKHAIWDTDHRVKNHLQIVSALAELQMDGDSDTVPISALKRILSHVRTLAGLHELLTQQVRDNAASDTLGTKDAFAQLLPVLQVSIGTRRLHSDIDDVLLPINNSTSVSLLIGELVSNAVKHGEGDILITLRRRDDRVHLTVADAGKGFPEGFDPRKAAKVGLDLILNLSGHDLCGDIAFENRHEGGASVVVTFPIAA